MNRPVFAVMTLLVSQSSVMAADLTVRTSADRATIRLSESVRVTLTVDGPAPLRVDVPNPLLDEPSTAAWRVRPVGSPIVMTAPSGRETWELVLRADPYQPGEPMRLGFLPLRAASRTEPLREFPIPAIDVRVTTAIGDPTTAEIRPPTGVENLANKPLTYSFSSVILAVVGFAVVAVIVGILRTIRRRPTPERTPAAVAATALEATTTAWVAGRLSAVEVADRCGNLVRRYVQSRYGLPTIHLTTPELLITTKNAELWKSEDQTSISNLLTHCDAMRFGQLPSDANDVTALLDSVNDFLTRLQPADSQSV